MDQNVEQLSSCIKKMAVYHKLFVKNLPEFNDPGFSDSVYNAIILANKETLTDYEIQDLIGFAEEFIFLRDQFLMSNPELYSPMNPSEVASLFDNLKSVLSTIKDQ
jgi:hypothetical protein